VTPPSCDDAAVKAVIWLVEGTWEGCVDAAARALPADATVALLHVSPPDAEELAETALSSLLGRALARYREAVRLEGAEDEAGEAILAAAAERLRRRDTETLQRRGRPEREVIDAVAKGVDLLVLARDGDRSRLGPKSLGHATRFVVDHAPCQVLLVWPDEPPSTESLPPPPRPPHGPGGGRPPRPPKHPRARLP
jgi:nucleotide-binding universal stress UspA family protein